MVTENLMMGDMEQVSFYILLSVCHCFEIIEQMGGTIRCSSCRDVENYCNTKNDDLFTVGPVPMAEFNSELIEIPYHF